MAENVTTVICSILSNRKSFGAYVGQLNDTTGFNVTLLQLCQSDICNALWGDGNADVSGIGVSNSLAHCKSKS